MQQIKNILLVVLSTIVGGVGSYLYHPVMNQYLTVADFAKFESLASMFVVLSTVTAGFGLYLTRTFSHMLDTDADLYRGSQRFFVLLGIMVYLIYLSCIWWIDSMLSIGSPMMVAIIGLTIPISFAGLTQSAWIQGNGKFGFLSLSSVLIPFGKLLFGWMFVMIGFGIFGAIGGFITSSLLYVVILFFYIQRSVRRGVPTSLLRVFYFFKKARIELLHFFLLAFILAVLQNIDLILVNRFFTGDIAGKYALISVIMKFIIFLAASVEIVYYRKLAHSDYSIHDLLAAIGLLSLGSLLGYILLQTIGYQILSGVNSVFEEFQYLISYFYIFCILFAWLSLSMKIAIAHGRYSVNIVALLIIGIQLYYMETHTNLSLIEYIVSYTFSILAILIYTMSILVHHIFYNRLGMRVRGSSDLKLIIIQKKSIILLTS